MHSNKKVTLAVVGAIALPAFAIGVLTGQTSVDKEQWYQNGQIDLCGEMGYTWYPDENGWCGQ